MGLSLSIFAVDTAAEKQNVPFYAGFCGVIGNINSYLLQLSGHPRNVRERKPF